MDNRVLGLIAIWLLLVISVIISQYFSRMWRRKNMGKIHRLKILEEYADRVLDGSKTFEVRLNDRDYKVGDAVIFTVIDEKGRLIDNHVLNFKHYRIEYILSDFGLIEGYVAFSIKPEV